MIDNREHEEILDILENMEDQQLAVMFLKEFNEKTARLGKLLMNRDESLGHDEWKKLCDQAKDDVERLVLEIRSLL